ncbi:MAG: WYL domain-containing protein [Actinomycetota bacterium]
MRADRLVAVLLLLQARGQVTAREVADELEISERTARRDLDALAVAGIPVYSVRGRYGGWRLLGDARTDLTGLRSAEARALVTMAAAAGQATSDFRTAVAKLTQALPEPIRAEADAVVATIVADDRPWGNVASVLHEPRRDEWLEPLQQAVLQRRRVDLGYERAGRPATRRVIEPFGLVTKQGSWYVVAATDAGRRTFRLDRITSATLLDECFEPPADFDLESAWEEITSGYVERSRRVTVEATIDDWAIAPLRSLGTELVLREALPGDDAGVEPRHRAELGAWTVEVLVAQIAGLSHRIELHDPPTELTELLARCGGDLVERYGSPPPASGS